MNNVIKMIASLFMALVLLSPMLVSAEEVKNGVTHISQQELAEKLEQDNSVLIDIRTLGEVKKGYIPGAVHIPLSKFKTDKSLLDEYLDKDIVFYCHSGGRVNSLTRYLQRIKC